ncbi:MAG: hypothetical protein JST04_14150 [Bdellovibrionales bacterium]|nr:hypothetical protein [Bdellovibrionales bacterium]
MIKTVASAAVSGIPALFFVLVSSCDRFTPTPNAPSSLPAIAPAGNELYVFPHGRLSMSAFEAIRREYPGVAPGDLAKIAMATQWLGTRVRPGKTATPAETTRCVRALFYPPAGKIAEASAVAFASDRFGITSLEQLRKEFHDAASGWVVEWNPSLAREYGIPGANR